MIGLKQDRDGDLRSVLMAKDEAVGDPDFVKRVYERPGENF